MFKFYQVSVECMKHLYGKCCASLGLRCQPTLMGFYNCVYQRLTCHPESCVDNMLAPKKRVSGSPGYESELRQWLQSKGHRKKRKQRHDRAWEKHLTAYLDLKGKKDPKNTKPKADYLPAPLLSWRKDQRHNYKVHFAGGKPKGLMNKERADKLVAAGIVGEKSTGYQTTWDEKWEKHLAAYLDLKGKKDPKNNKPKADYLPAPLLNWWVDQRHNYKVCLAGGKTKGLMNKEWADKLVAAGIVEPLRNFGSQVPTSSCHRVTLFQGHPGCPCCAPYSHLTRAGGASLAPGQGAADG